MQIYDDNVIVQICIIHKMIKQTKIKKCAQQSLEPWAYKQQLHDNQHIQYIIGSNPENLEHLLSEQNSQLKYISGIKRKSKSNSRKQYQHADYARLMPITPRDNMENQRGFSIYAQTLDYVKKNQKEVKWFQRKWSENDPKIYDNNQFVPLNGRPTSPWRRPVINTTCIGYLEESPTFFGSQQKYGKHEFKKSHTSTFFRQHDLTVSKKRPTTCSTSKNMSIKNQNRSKMGASLYENNINKSNQNTTCMNHLQKMLRIKQKLRKKMKKKSALSISSKTQVYQQCLSGNSVYFATEMGVQQRRWDLSHQQKINLIEKKGEKNYKNNQMLGNSLKKWAERSHARKNGKGNTPNVNHHFQVLTVKGGGIYC